MTIKGPDGTIIDTRELRKIKISIIHEESSLSTKDQSMSKEIERDIINPDDIILPRRQSKVLYQSYLYSNTYNCLMFIIEKCL